MNALLGVSIATAIVYGIFIDGTFFKIYSAMLVIYFIVTQVLLKNNKNLTKRKNIMVASWGGNTFTLAYKSFYPI